MEKKRLKLLVFALAIALNAGFANADIETSLTAYWPFNDGSGTTALDASGNEHHGTLHNGPAWVDGPGGSAGALSFDFIDDYIECGTYNPTSADELTVSFWAYCDGPANGLSHEVVIGTGTGWISTRIQIYRDKTDGYIGMLGASPNRFCTFDGAAVLGSEVWAHFVLTFDSLNVAKIYRDGMLLATGTWPIKQDGDDGPVNIGTSKVKDGDIPHQPWNGMLDEIRFYDRTLTEDDAMELFGYASDPAGNSPPRVDAGSYQSLLWPDTAQLDGTVNDDGKPYQDPPADPCTPVGLTLTWSKFSGPGNVQFSDNTIEDPTATFSAAGMYELQLSAFDGEKDACDVVKIYIRPNDDPIAHWDFDEGSGTTVDDDSANNNEGALAGDPEPNWVTGWVGSGAMDFFGVGGTDVSSYVNITTDPTAADPNLDSLRYDITLAAWFRIDDLANAYHPAIIATSNTGWRLYVETPANDLYGKVTFTPGDSICPYDSRAFSTRSVDDGYWHHVVGIYDGSKSYLYVDGVLDVTVDISGLLDTTDGVPVTIGARATSAIDVERSWNGMIDDARIYSYSLSAAQVEALAAMGSLVPVVDAGENQTFSMQNDYLQLDGTVTDDGKPVAATLEWSKTSGPGDVVFSDTAIEDPTATFFEIGTYVLRLTADDTTVVVYDEVTITVENPTCQDVINDGLLIIGDFSGSEGTPDCYIDIYDFAVFAGNWLRCNDPQDPECEFPY